MKDFEIMQKLAKYHYFGHYFGKQRSRIPSTIWLYMTTYKVAANSQPIWCLILTFKNSYYPIGFSKIYWCSSSFHIQTVLVSIQDTIVTMQFSKPWFCLPLQPPMSHACIAPYCHYPCLIHDQLWVYQPAYDFVSFHFSFSHPIISFFCIARVL